MTSTGDGRNRPFMTGGRQLSVDGTSRVTGDGQARFCESLGAKFPGATRLVSRRTRFLWRRPCCTRDEGRSFGAGFQEQASNNRKLLRPNGRGGERYGKGGTRSRHVGSRETNAREHPLE